MVRTDCDDTLWQRHVSGRTERDIRFRSAVRFFRFSSWYWQWRFLFGLSWLRNAFVEATNLFGIYIPTYTSTFVFRVIFKSLGCRSFGEARMYKTALLCLLLITLSTNVDAGKLIFYTEHSPLGKVPITVL